MRRLLFATSALVPLGIAAAAANPLGGNVVGGSATISGTGTPSVVINQSSQRAVINWNQFNIGSGESTQFIQPNSSSTVLNRVLGDPNPSQIMGTLSANGKVFLINPNGVLIGNGAVINTAGFMATTADIANADFMAGRYNFNIPGRPDASIVNLGTITATNGGFAALVAPGVRNSGTITATFGKIGLASANTFSLDLYGDKLIQLGVSDSIAGNVRDVATGETLKSLVTNDGKLKANGGRVELSAVAARHVVDSVINTSGVIEARSIGTHNGKIVLGAATGASKPAGAPTQTVKVSGKLDASSKKGKGGKVEVVAENIVINDARIDVSGQTGGGTVLIGGDIGGGKGNALVTASLEPYAIGTASTVSINSGTVIDASARSTGNGGKVVVWSDDHTSFSGLIKATGGAVSGDGGFAEVSGKNTLSYTGLADMRAPNGSWGTLLLDPGDITIVSGGSSTTTPAPGSFTGSDTGDNVLTVGDLLIALNSANVIVQTGTGIGACSGTCLGNINVNATISGWNQPTTLTLSAFNDIFVNQNITASAGGNLVLRADSTGSGGGTVFLNATISTSGNVSIYYNPLTYIDLATKSDSFSNPYTANVTGGATLRSYMLVNNPTDLNDIRTNLSGRYALGRDIDMDGFGAFAPIGAISPTQFTGILDGFGGIGVNRTISNLEIAPTGPTQTGVGLFGVIGATGIVRNLNIDSATVTPNPNLNVGLVFGQFVGVLAGQNAGTISGVTITNSTILSGVVPGQIIAGGVVGQNGLFGPGSAFGTITGSQADVNITLGNALGLTQLNVAGGLVGSNPGTISSSSASGDIVIGSNSIAGGLVGQNGAFGTPGAPGLIQNSSATGTVSSPTGTNVNVGGLVGFNFTDGTIIDSTYTGQVSATGSLAPCNNGPNCQFIAAGGLVGVNDGVIVATGDFVTNANGSVTVSAGGVAGGLVGFNGGIIDGAQANVTVVGSSGTSNDGGNTVLGGFVGTNAGIITGSRAQGNVGVAETTFMLVGGFVGDNSGRIEGSEAFGNVTAGNVSQAGGFAGTTSPFDCGNCGGGSGIGFNQQAKILDSSASGNVTVGTSSLAGGFVAGTNGTVENSNSSGIVSGGANSLLGGFVGVLDFGGKIQDSTSSSPVIASGPNSWLGGFVGFSGGSIKDSTASGSLLGTSNSIMGGFVAVNFGFIDPSSASGNVLASGSNNVMGGFFGVNFGTIQTVSASGVVNATGENNVIGTLGGANATFINYPPGLIPQSSFPSGTVTGSSGTIGATNPTSLPAYPLVLDQCDQALCELYKQGILGVPGNTIPSTVQTPPAFLYIQPPDNTTPIPTLVQLTTPPGGTGAPGTGPGAGPSGPATFPGARPGIAGFSPPPFQLRLGPDGMIPSAMPASNETRFVQNQLLMRIDATTLTDAVRAILARYGITVQTIEPLGALGGALVTLQLPPGMTVRQAIALLESDRRMPQLSTNSTFALSQAISTKGDPAQYLLDKFQIGKTHQTATGKGITIAVIDSEADKRHSELKGAISEEYNTLTAPPVPHSHGTAMVGAIASRDRLLGVAPNARILAVSAFGEAASAEGTTASIIRGIEWAMSQNARVINMSFAGPRDPALERALKLAFDYGLVLVAAAGNAGPKSPPLYPAADPHVIAVTATDVRDRGFRGANQGAQVSVSAPGVEILAPAPDAGYQMSTGTSIATAHVSGVVALMLERNPQLKPADVRRIIEETATDLGPKGKDAQYGWGLVNPQKALEAAAALIKSSDASQSRR